MSVFGKSKKRTSQGRDVLSLRIKIENVNIGNFTISAERSSNNQLCLNAGHDELRINGQLVEYELNNKNPTKGKGTSDIKVTSILPNPDWSELGVFGAVLFFTDGFDRPSIYLTIGKDHLNSFISDLRWRQPNYIIIGAMKAEGDEVDDGVKSKYHIFRFETHQNSTERLDDSGNQTY